MQYQHQVRIVADCERAMIADGWNAFGIRVLIAGERGWEVRAYRDDQNIVSRAWQWHLAWMGALQQSRMLKIV